MPARVYVPVSGHENGYAVLMQLRYRYRVDPQPRHLPGFARAFGCTRFVVNDALAFREAAHATGQPYPGRADLSARLTVIKATPGSGTARSRWTSGCGRAGRAGRCMTGT
jgi:hypothetical protein